MEAPRPVSDGDAQAPCMASLSGIPYIPVWVFVVKYHTTSFLFKSIASLLDAAFSYDGAVLGCRTRNDKVVSLIPTTAITTPQREVHHVFSRFRDIYVTKTT